jgi:hypothetical protein
MNVQSHTQKSRGRLPDLTPFDLEEPAAPAVPLSHPDCEPKDGDMTVEGGASAHGCVEWFRYAHRTRSRAVAACSDY